MTAKEFNRILLAKFPHQPTTIQAEALEQLAEFVLAKEKNQLFLLKGFAGTGKTTIIGCLTKHL